MQHITLVCLKLGLDFLLKNWDFRVFGKQALSKKLGLLPKFVTHPSPLKIRPVYMLHKAYYMLFITYKSKFISGI